MAFLNDANEIIERLRGGHQISGPHDALSIGRGFKVYAQGNETGDHVGPGIAKELLDSDILMVRPSEDQLILELGPNSN